MAKPLPAQFVKGVVRVEDLPRSRVPEIAASGRSNVGKSSMLNIVFGRKALAKVSQRPGKTREINYFDVAGRYHLVDLPGYGYAAVPERVKRKWGALVKEYLETREQLAGVIQLIDARHEPTALDREMLTWLRDARLDVLVVATKTDKLKRNAVAGTLRALEKEVPGMQVVPFSAPKRDGRGPILHWIDGIVEQWTPRKDAREGA